MMQKVITLSLRAVQAVLALGNLALSAYLIDWYLTRTRFAPPHIFIFLLVAPILSILSILYLEITPRYAPRATHAFVALAVECVNGIFYLAGFIALAKFLAELEFCNGVPCDVGRANVVVATLSFVAWVATCALIGVDIFKGGLRAPSTLGSWGHSRRPSLSNQPLPQMTQPSQA